MEEPTTTPSKREVTQEVQQFINRKAGNTGYELVIQLSRVERDPEDYNRIQTLGMSMDNGQLRKDPETGEPLIIFQSPYSGLKPFEEILELDDVTLKQDDLRVLVFDGQHRFDSIQYSLDPEYTESILYEAIGFFKTLRGSISTRWMNPKNLMQTWNLLYGMTETKLRDQDKPHTHLDVVREMRRTQPTLSIEHGDGWTFLVSSLGIDTEGENTLSIDRITINLQKYIEKHTSRHRVLEKESDEQIIEEFQTMSIQFIESTPLSQKMFVDNTGLDVYRFEKINMPDSYNMEHRDLVEQRVLVGPVYRMAEDYVDGSGVVFDYVSDISRVTGYRMVYNGGGFFLSMHNPRPRTALGELSDKPTDSVWVSGAYLLRNIEIVKQDEERHGEVGQRRIEFANGWYVSWDDDANGKFFIRTILHE